MTDQRAQKLRFAPHQRGDFASPRLAELFGRQRWAGPWTRGQAEHLELMLYRAPSLLLHPGRSLAHPPAHRFHQPGAGEQQAHAIVDAIARRHPSVATAEWKHDRRSGSLPRRTELLAGRKRRPSTADGGP